MPIDSAIDALLPEAEKQTSVFAKTDTAIEVALQPSKPSNVLIVSVDTSEFPKAEGIFARLEMVTQVNGVEQVLCSCELAGGPQVAPDGSPAEMSALMLTLGYEYDQKGDPVYRSVSDVKARVVPYKGEAVGGALAVAADSIVIDAPAKHHSVSVTQAGNGATFTNASGTLTLGSNTATGSNRVAYCCHSCTSGSATPASASATYDGVAQTKIDSQLVGDDGVSNSGIAEVYRLVAPNTTSNADQKVVLTGTGNYGALVTLLLDGVDQTTPEGTIVKGIGTGNVGAGAVTLPSNGLIFDSAHINSATVSGGDPAASHTLNFEGFGFTTGVTNFYYGSSQYTQSSGSQSLGWSGFTPVQDHWGQIIVPVQAAAAAAASSRYYYDMIGR